MSSDLDQLDLPADLPSLPDGWNWTTLSRLVDPDRGICYGIVQPGKHHSDGVPMVNTGDVLDGRVNLEIGFRVEKKLHDQFRRSTLRGGELLVTLVGANFGRVAIAPPEFIGHNCSRAVGVVPLRGNTEFVMFALRSPVARHFFDTWANTTAQPTFNLKDLGKLPVPVPPVESARKISNMLMALDGRITLLRETNATLEAIAQALFKSWFVDFDPVRAKAEGLEPQAMDPTTAALFPDSFEESKLGLVPKGWRVGPVGDSVQVVDYVANGSFASLKENVTLLDVPSYALCVRTTDYNSGFSGSFRYVDKQAYDFLSKSSLTGNEVLISNVGDVGTVFRAPSWLGMRMTLGSNAVALKAPELSGFLFFYFKGAKGQHDIQSVVTGSAQLKFNKTSFRSLSVAIPEASVLQRFESIAGEILTKIDNNLAQVKTLTQLRDTLLPRLISGQLRLTEAEALVEEACA